MKWTEQLIGRVLARQVFQSKHLIIIPNCKWTGDEIDLLVVTPDLRIIDVEVKISRADLKSGIIVLRDTNPHAHIIRRAKPCRDAKSISPEDAVNLARLASLRMWDAYDELEKMRAANTARRA